jgi:hypothetical protein
MIKNDFALLRDRMCNILGISEEDFLHDRHYPTPYARAIVADYLYNLGYRWQQIGKVMNKTHATMIIMCKRLHEIKDLKECRQIQLMYEKFYQEEYDRD